MSPDEMMELALQHFPHNSKAFYGSAASLALGAGVFYDQIDTAIYDEEDHLFETGRAVSLVLTHECDADQANEREFNKNIVSCPVIPWTEFHGYCKQNIEPQKTRALIINISKFKVNRLALLPPAFAFPATPLAKGGIIYLNHISTCHVSEFMESRKLCALTSSAMYRFQEHFGKHFLRPKDQKLPPP